MTNRTLLSIPVYDRHNIIPVAIIYSLSITRCYIIVSVLPSIIAIFCLLQIIVLDVTNLLLILIHLGIFFFLNIREKKVMGYVKIYKYYPLTHSIFFLPVKTNVDILFSAYDALPVTRF